MTNKKFPFAPGLSLDQAKDTADKINDQYKEQITEAKNIENRLGAKHTFPEYLGRL